MMKFWQAIKNPLLTALFVLLGMYLYVNFSYALPFGYHQTNKDALFTADGRGEVTYTPDTSLIYLSVEKTATTQDEAKSEANKIIDQITADLKKLGVAEKDIKTTNLSVNPNYNNQPMSEAQPESGTVSNKMVAIPVRPTTGNGYTANASLEVRVTPLDKAQQAIDAATKDGATQVGTSQMVVDNAKQKDLEDQARLQAVKNAKEKAQQLANAAGIHLGRVISVQENNGGFVRPMLMKTDMAQPLAVGSAPTQLNPGENTISVSVTLSYETY